MTPNKKNSVETVINAKKYPKLAKTHIRLSKTDGVPDNSGVGGALEITVYPAIADNCIIKNRKVE